MYWTYPDTDNHEEKRLEPVNEFDYTEICPEFKGTYFEEVYEILKRQFGKIGRVRILMKPPRSCLSWHRDLLAHVFIFLLLPMLVVKW